MTSQPKRNSIRSSCASYLAALVFVCCSGSILAQSQAGNLYLQDAEEDLAHGEALLRSFKNDSAGVLAAKIITELQARDLLDSPIGIKAQLLEASALERDEQNELAVQKLLQVLERCREKEQWDLLAKAGLSIALLYEKLKRGDQSREHLKQTKVVIEDYALDSIYPSWAVRISSWHRIFGDRDSSMFYATEALRTAPGFNKLLEEADGHLIVSNLLRDSLPDEMLKHCIAGLRLYQKLEDYTSCGYMYIGIASYYYHNKKDYLSALVYNDSLIAAANKAIEKGHENHPSIAGAYRFRGAILKELGQIDSAWVYQRKGYEMELQKLRQSTAAQVIEIDARYNDEKKTQQIEEQTLALRLKNNQLRYSAIITVLILLLAAGLYFAFYKQRQAKSSLAEQNAIIRQQTEQLKTLDAAKSRFFANVSHELRTPLTLILGPIKTLLQESQLTEKQARLLNMTNQSGKQLEQLVNEILDLQKLEAGKMEIQLQPTELSAFFGSYAAQFGSLAQRKAIDFSFEMVAGHEAVANIDREKCRQILYNLLSNAFKFTPEGGQIKSTLSLNNNTLELVVADTGPGIHPDDLPHLFDRFFQTNLPDQPADGGTGIGLALCQEYAVLFGGKIEAESTPGNGSVFRVVFPVEMVDHLPALSFRPAPDDSAITSAAMPVERKAPGMVFDEAKPTLLVVEDNPQLQDYMRLILEEKYNVITAEHGQAALNCLLHTANCQLILSDLMMPVMDGYQLLEKLKNDDATRHIPVIMLTARAEVKDKLKALRIGVDDYLTKPFDEEELLVRIENLLKNQAARREDIPNEAEAWEADLPIVSAADRDWLEAFEVCVQKNLSNDLFSIPMLAQEFMMSQSTLLRQLRRLTGLTPVQYLLEMRLNKARQLLEDRTYDSLAKVAAESGYSDLRSFSRSFRLRFGKLPSEV